jgi:hypothetical protein
MKFDLQDLLLVLGISCIVGGIAVWSRPAAAIVLGCFFLFAVLQIERGGRARKATSGSADK